MIILVPPPLSCMPFPFSRKETVMPATMEGDGKTIYVKKQRAAELASGYSAGKRRMEISSLLIFAISFTWCCYRGITSTTSASLPFVLLAIPVGMLFADFFSGIVHWGCDTWGTVKTPIFSAFIRSFREHHVDPMAITRHDFVEANGDNCLVCVPALLLLAVVRADLSSSSELFIFVSLLTTAFFVSITNQIHKWSHTMSPPAYVRFLQESNIILSRKVHNIHHQNPYDRYYCITTGWLNPLLGAINFWGAMEAAIQALLSQVPREDDQYWTSLKKDETKARAHPQQAE